MEQHSIPPSVALNKEFVIPQEIDKDGSVATDNQRRIMHGFSVGYFGLLISSDLIVSEVFESLPTCPLPNTPSWFYGMANQRGNIIPVFNMPAILGLEQDTIKKPLFLVIGEKNDAFGILTNELPERVEIKPEYRLENTPPLPEIIEPYTHGYYEVDGRMWVDWEPFDFISAVSGNM